MSLAEILQIFKISLKTVSYVMCYLEFHCWRNFCTNQISFGGVILEKPPRSSQKLYFLLLRKHLKVYNLTTRNGIMMKLTSIMYLNDTFHLVKKLGRNTKGVRGRKRKTSKNDLQNQFSCSILSVSLKLNTNRNIFDSLL